MVDDPDEFIEVRPEGVQFVMEYQSITTDKNKIIPREKIPSDEMPIENIVIDGITNIESVDDESGPFIRMKYETVEYTASKTDSSQCDDRSFYKELKSATGIYFDDTTKEFTFTDEKSDKINFVNFIQFLFEEHHITRGDLPYQTKYAWNSYLINTEPEDQNGDQMDSAGEPVDGVYVATHYAKDQKKKYMKELVNDFVNGESIDI